MRHLVAALLLTVFSLLVSACVSEHAGRFDRAMSCLGQKDWACTERDFGWIIDNHPAGLQEALGWRAETRLMAGDRRGAIADGDLLVQKFPGDMRSHYTRGRARADYDRLRTLGASVVRANTDPPVDFEGAKADFTRCAGLASASPAKTEYVAISGCLKGIWEMKELLGQDATDDEQAYRSFATRMCDEGLGCDTEIGLHVSTEAAPASNATPGTQATVPEGRTRCSVCGGSGQVEVQETYQQKVQDLRGVSEGKLVDEHHFETKTRYVRRSCTGCAGRGYVD
jgi:hypothetical protein